MKKHGLPIVSSICHRNALSQQFEVKCGDVSDGLGEQHYSPKNSHLACAGSSSINSSMLIFKALAKFSIVVGCVFLLPFSAFTMVCGVTFAVSANRLTDIARRSLQYFTRNFTSVSFLVLAYDDIITKSIQY